MPQDFLLPCLLQHTTAPHYCTTLLHHSTATHYFSTLLHVVDPKGGALLCDLQEGFWPDVFFLPWDRYLFEIISDGNSCRGERRPIDFASVFGDSNKLPHAWVQSKGPEVPLHVLCVRRCAAVFAVIDSCSYSRQYLHHSMLHLHVYHCTCCALCVHVVGQGCHS